MGELIQFPLLRRQDQMAIEDTAREIAESGKFPEGINSQGPNHLFKGLSDRLKEHTCQCGMWPVEEYGEICPSCNDFVTPQEAEAKLDDEAHARMLQRRGLVEEFEVEVDEEEFNTDYLPAEAFEGTYEPTQSSDAPPRLVGSPEGRWVHQEMVNPSQCYHCGAWRKAGWSWFDRVIARFFTCDDCAEAL